MDNKKFLWAGLTLLILASLFLAVQSVVASSLPSGSPCGNGNITDGVIKVFKTVRCEKDTNWEWSIIKSADKTDLTLSLGQTLPVNYTVTASAIATSDYSVGGIITIVNPAGRPTVAINSVVDALGDVGVCTSGGVPISFPYDLPGGSAIDCSYSGSQNTQPAENTATVNYGAGVDITVHAPINWSGVIPTETNECANISDTYPGGPNTQVCANGQQTFTYNYTRWIGPYDVCGSYTIPNTASVVPTEGGPSDSANWTVNVTVPCAGGCTLTPGYWKTHSIYGPAPYDDTWAQIGENTTFFLSGQSYYNVLWTSPRGNAYYILAHAYIAAKLNFLNGADSTPAVDAAFATATTLFQTYTPAYIGSLPGNSPLRAQFISLATVLDNYNNGLIGPGHCSE